MTRESRNPIRLTPKQRVVVPTRNPNECCACLFPNHPFTFPDEDDEHPRDINYRSAPRLGATGKIKYRDISENVHHFTDVRHDRHFTTPYWIETRASCLCNFGCFLGWSILCLTLGILSVTVFMDIDKTSYEGKFVSSQGGLLGMECFNPYLEDLREIPLASVNFTETNGRRNLRFYGLRRGENNAYELQYKVSFHPETQDINPVIKNHNTLSVYTSRFTIEDTEFDSREQCTSKANDILRELRVNTPAPGEITFDGFYDKTCTREATEQPSDCFTYAFPVYDVAGLAVLCGLLVGAGTISLTTCIILYIDFRCCNTKKPHTWIYIPPHMIDYEMPTSRNIPIQTPRPPSIHRQTVEYEPRLLNVIPVAIPVGEHEIRPVPSAPYPDSLPKNYGISI